MLHICFSGKRVDWIYNIGLFIDVFDSASGVILSWAVVVEMSPIVWVGVVLFGKADQILLINIVKAKA